MRLVFSTKANHGPALGGSQGDCPFGQVLLIVSWLSVAVAQAPHPCRCSSASGLKLGFTQLYTVFSNMPYLLY
jgi:hypothetical protein